MQNTIKKITNIEVQKDIFSDLSTEIKNLKVIKSFKLFESMLN